MSASDFEPQLERVWRDPWPSRSGPEANAWYAAWEKGPGERAAQAPIGGPPSASCPTAKDNE